MAYMIEAEQVGAEPHNQTLSLARADSVREALRALGVPRDRIFLRGFGESAAAIPAPDGFPEPQNRRVKLSVTY